ncbi:hypothetical protein D1871_11190 [Nakamurella silvestris]|nr:hypothetical protein D1871_11190 [Nakamurella silvestris]
MATITNLTIIQGIAFEQSWEIVAFGSPVDNSWTGKCQIRPFATSEVVLHEFPVEIASGVARIQVSPEVSADWVWTSGVFDLVLTPEGGKPYQIIQGAVAVVGRVSR